MKKIVGTIMVVVLSLLMAISLAACEKKLKGVGINGYDSVSANNQEEYSAYVIPSGASGYGSFSWSISGENTVGAEISESQKDSRLCAFKATTAGTVTISVEAGGFVAYKTITVNFIEATKITVFNESVIWNSPFRLKSTLEPYKASNTNITYELIDNPIGATLTGDQITSDTLGTVTYRARIGDLVSNTATITFTLNPKQGETIITAEQFSAIRNKPSGKFQLGADIDFSDYEGFTPIGAFSGALNGNGYTVKGLTLESRSGNLAPFTSVSGSIIDITFEVDIKSTSYDEVAVGGVCAVLANGGVINNVTVDGKVEGNRCIAGGIVGKLEGGTISNATMRGEVVGDECFVGGIVGKVSSGLLENSKNYASVTSESYVASIAGGGVCGYLEKGAITECDNYGKVNVRTSCGGVVGKYNLVGGATLTGATNYGEITGKKYVGGVVGNINVVNRFALADWHNEGDVMGEEFTGGVVGYLYCRVDIQNDDAVVSTVRKMTNSGNISGKNNAAGIFGYFYGELFSSWMRKPSFILQATEMENTGDITGTTYVGGIIGYAFTDNVASFIEGAKSSGEITGEALLGGIAGKLENIKVTACDNEGTTINATSFITEGSEKLVYAGGYVGYGYEVSECVNKSDITYNNLGRKLGGIAGFLNGNIRGCENFGNIQGVDSDYIGGIVGEIKFAGAFNVLDLKNHGNVTGRTHIGGLIGAINCNYSGNAVSTLRKLYSDGITKAIDIFGGLFGVVNVGVLSATEFTFAGDLKTYGVVTQDITYGHFGASVKTNSNDSKLIGWTWLIEGSVPGFEFPDRELIGEMVKFSIER